MSPKITKKDFLIYKKVKLENHIVMTNYDEVKKVTGLTINQQQLIRDNYGRLNHLYNKK